MTQTLTFQKFWYTGMREYLSWFYKGLAYNPEAITQEDIYEFVKQYSGSCAMRAGFEYYRAFPIDAEQNKKIINQSKLQMPISF